ncbi:MAG: [Fe-Fe] hydrogenase large subunit C-terminal domain-containing protein [Clostridiales bacterium]|nr:[Fe-Fe] hydrogenase large subunit C-terminal domain-containing protein [Clostridiales bacterium]
MNKRYLDIFRKVVKLQREGKLVEGIDDIKLQDMDEDMLKGYLSSAMGQEPDSNVGLKEIAKKALNEYSEEPILTLVGDCRECIKNDEECKCMASCPFNAMILDRDAGKIKVNTDNCKGCGECEKACRRGKIIDKIQYLPIVNMINGGFPVYAAIAPAYIGQFGNDVTYGKLRTAFKMLGFKDLYEVSVFADIISIREVIEFDRLVKDTGDFMITSCCCPVWMNLLKRHYKNLLAHVTPSVSPMVAAGRVIKRIYPEAKVVFVGPCIAKKSEAREEDIKDAIDFVLTFDELDEILKAAAIDPKKLHGEESEYSSKGGRIYARTGGVSECIKDTLKSMFPAKAVQLKATQGNGIRECKQLLDRTVAGEIDVNFLEGMGCIGGCVGGPKAIIDKEKGRESVNKYGDESKYRTPVDSPCVLKILKSIGINSIEELEENNEKSHMFLRNL